MQNLNGIIKDPASQKLIEEKLKEKYIIIAQPINIINDINEQKRLIKLYHDDPILGGHCGLKRLFNKINVQNRWQGMTKDIRDYVRNCKHCQLNKPGFKSKPLYTKTPTT